jgi:hypothetical protein
MSGFDLIAAALVLGGVTSLAIAVLARLTIVGMLDAGGRTDEQLVRLSWSCVGLGLLLLVGAVVLAATLP